MSKKKMSVGKALDALNECARDSDQGTDGVATKAFAVVSEHIARVEAERDALQERLDDIGPVRTIV